MKVSVIIPCKNRLEHLRECLPRVFRQIYKELEVIVVDYNCPQHSGAWAEHVFNCKVVYCDVEPNEWSLSTARNKGFLESTGDIVLFLDADALLTDPLFIHKHVKHLVEGSFICGWGYSDATGCMMCHRSAFEAVKGYNEVLKSWGAEDIDIYNRFEQKLCIERRVWQSGIETIKHGDEMRNFFHGGRNPMETNEENFKIAQEQLSQTTFRL